MFILRFKVILGLAIEKYKIKWGGIDTNGVIDLYIPFVSLPGYCTDTPFD
ncbi:hypothetical protein [uncultured Croceitalea sp.]